MAVGRKRKQGRPPSAVDGRLSESVGNATSDETQVRSGRMSRGVTRSPFGAVPGAPAPGGRPGAGSGAEGGVPAVAFSSPEPVIEVRRASGSAPAPRYFGDGGFVARDAGPAGAGVDGAVPDDGVDLRGAAGRDGRSGKSGKTTMDPRKGGQSTANSRRKPVTSLSGRDSSTGADGEYGSVPVGLPSAPRSGGDAVPAPSGADSSGRPGDSESPAAQGAESSGADTVQDDSYGDVSRETSDIPHPRMGDVSRETSATDIDDDLPLAMEAKRAVKVLNPGGNALLPRPAHRRVMCIANQKGGVGKTTTTVNVAVALALHGNRVLVIDLDPQGNASTGLGVDHHAGVPSIYDALIDNVPLWEVTQQVEGIPNLACVPATIDLAGAEIELVSVVARESRLKRAIESYPEELDYVLIDCPPSLGLLTVNALVAAEEVMIPIQCEYYALEGLGQLIRNIDLVQAHLNPRIEVSTILLTMYDKRTRLADQVEQEVRGYFADKVLQAVIPRNVRVSEAPSYGQSVMTYDPGSRGATSYFEAAQEIAQRGAKLGGGA